MSIQEEANLILRLYEQRRESVMRTARDWYFREFHPESPEDFDRAMWSEHSGHLRERMVFVIRPTPHSQRR